MTWFILAMNSRVQHLCKESGVGNVDMFTLFKMFQGNPDLACLRAFYFGLHQSNQGKQLYAETLKININKFGN